jgi:hypothetical protein
MCPDIWAPVCGCDGVTYSNNCERLVAGAQLDHEGECASPVGPFCSPDGGGWYSMDGTLICESSCATCVAECLNVGMVDEGWYAVCRDAGDTGCGYFWDPELIQWGTCS